MTDRPPVLSAKVAKLAAIIADANPTKSAPPGGASQSDVRAAQAEAAREVIETGGSVADVERIQLPSERL